MIISASRRTDLPAFHTSWLLNRLDAGFCQWRNPYNPKQTKIISLAEKDVTAFVFWSKNPAPLLPHLPKFEGYRYYLQFTLNNYPRFESKLPDLAARLATFQKLAEALGPERVVWRYDPIIISSVTPYHYHLEAFAKIAGHLKSYTKQVMISFCDFYRKLNPQIAKWQKEGITVTDPVAAPDRDFVDFCQGLVQVAAQNGIRLRSCSEKLPGIKAGACIDRELLRELGVEKPLPKDRYQRAECLCRKAIDIGTYNTCPYFCDYCYANGKTIQSCDPEAPFLGKS